MTMPWVLNNDSGLVLDWWKQKRELALMYGHDDLAQMYADLIAKAEGNDDDDE